MSYTQILNHADQAVARLHSKHKGLANIEALVRILVNPCQDIETALWELHTERLIDSAVGEQLNVLGRVVGQVRDGLSDDDYRRYIRARIAANKSKGRWSDLIIVARLILNESDAVLVMSNQDYSTILMNVTATLVDADLAAILITFLRDTKSDVERVLFQYSASLPEDTYTLGSITTLLGPLMALSVPIGSTTLDLSDASGFDASGSVILEFGAAGEETVTYAGKSGNTLTGVSPTIAAHLLASQVRTGPSTTQGLEDDTAPGTGGRLASVIA